jgi:hypothetical protein
MFRTNSIRVNVVSRLPHACELLCLPTRKPRGTSGQMSGEYVRQSIQFTRESCLGRARSFVLSSHLTRKLLGFYLYNVMPRNNDEPKVSRCHVESDCVTGGLLCCLSLLLV